MQQAEVTPTRRLPKLPSAIRPLRAEQRCFICSATGIQETRAVYSKGVCQPHYQKSYRLGIEPQKFIELLDVDRRLPNNDGVQVTPRIRKATYEALKRAVKGGAAKSVYRLTARILEEWALKNAPPAGAEAEKPDR
jgi:hypothetical protein